MADVEIRELGRDELATAAGVLARGMRDNPIHVAAFGRNPEQRLRVLSALFHGSLPLMTQPPLAAVRAGQIVGILGMAPPGSCKPSLRGGLRLAPRLLLRGPGGFLRAMTWFSAWSSRDPAEPHWHLGPVGVEAGLQGQGIGSRLMAAFCERMDTAGAVAYLETDKPENVTFYLRRRNAPCARGISRCDRRAGHGLVTSASQEPL